MIQKFRGDWKSKDAKDAETVLKHTVEVVITKPRMQWLILLKSEVQCPVNIQALLISSTGDDDPVHF
jgi:hypothetical protein